MSKLIRLPPLQVLFGRVLMKPGKPLTFAVVPSSQGARRMLVFGLPGNPVSSLVTWHLVVVPVLRKLAGWRDPMLRRVHVRTVRARTVHACVCAGP